MKEKLSWLNSSYTLGEKIDFLHYRIAHPDTRNRSGLTMEPEPMKWSGGLQTQGTRIGFIGDFMPIGQRRLVLGDKLREQLSHLDYLVINIEGVITSERRYLAVAFDDSILEQISLLFPQRLIFNVANNHSADFGSMPFQRELEKLRAYGQIVGADEEGMKLPEGIFIRSATMLSNQPIKVCSWANRKDDMTNSSPNTSRGDFNIFLPHWGYEMHLYPEQWQADFAKRLLDGGWDAVIGSHPHVPQPLWHRDDDKICLFSLGNFCYDNVNPNHSYGKLLTLDISDGQLVSYEQHYTRQTLEGKSRLQVDIVDSLDYKSLRTNTKKSLRYLSDLIK